MVSIVQLVERWIVAPKVVGSSPSIYPIDANLLLKKINRTIFKLTLLLNEVLINFLYKTYFLSYYYSLNDLIWQEALLIDFLQKKIINNWTQKFLVVSSYLFNERVVFDSIIKFFLELFIWPLHKLFIFQINNIGNLFTSIFFFWCLCFIFLVYCYFFSLLF